MEFPREISSLDLTLSQQKYFVEKGFHTVREIEDQEFDIKLPIEELTEPPKTKIACELLGEEQISREIYSYIENLDNLLKGVLRAGSVTEFVGLPGSGRTQLCLHLSVSAQIIEHSLSGEVIYICTNSDFSISRLKDIIYKYRKRLSCLKDLTETDILKNIYVINIMSLEELLDCLEYLNDLTKEHKNITLVIIDSITYPLRLCDRNEKTFVIHFLVKKLRHLGKIYNFATVLTNDMTTIVESSGSEVVPCLKDTFYHMINNRIIFSKYDDVFQAEILKCSTKFPEKCNFKFFDETT